MNTLEKRLLNDFQRDLPPSPTPFAVMAEELGVTEEDVIGGLRTLTERGVVSRVGPVFRPQRCGASSLVAMTVPETRLEAVAELINAFPEVNHNYEREHRFNLWFVITADTEEHLQALLQHIEQQTGLATLPLPMLTEYHIDLGFPLQWD
ncbi:MAG TPA: Lrp/AsnC family transcriptional regulator [Chromatiales bacterium]|nr:Lrp/AsnC family transcriptional regulator [Chromatiales bacterium]HEX22917.1 Lrp/AsnC family transcriptional regulator [Chromatiales bacterium]